MPRTGRNDIDEPDFGRSGGNAGTDNNTDPANTDSDIPPGGGSNDYMGKDTGPGFDDGDPDGTGVGVTGGDTGGNTDTGDGAGDTTGNGSTDTGGGTSTATGGDESVFSPAKDVTGGNAPAGGSGPGIPDSGTGMDAKQTDWEVTREQTVMGQLEDNYDQNSPFFELAAERAKRGHQSAGGQNSLMAEQAGIVAAMDEAYKASYADAQTFARSAEFNAAMKNQFGLAEQRFIHNATLSDQNFAQSKVMLQQEIQGQMDLMDKDYQQYFSKAAYANELAIDQLWEAADIHEGQEQRGFSRTMALNGATSMSAFMSNGFASVMDSANNPNFTPEQSRAAFESGMSALTEQWNVMDSYWQGQVSGTSSGQGEASYPYSDAVTQNYGYYGPESGAWMDWYKQNYPAGG